MDDRAILKELSDSAMDDRAISMRTLESAKSDGRSGYLYEDFGGREGTERSGYLYENFREQAIFMRFSGSAEEKGDWAQLDESYRERERDNKGTRLPL